MEEKAAIMERLISEGKDKDDAFTVVKTEYLKIGTQIQDTIREWPEGRNEIALTIDIEKMLREATESIDTTISVNVKVGKIKQEKNEEEIKEENCSQTLTEEVEEGKKKIQESEKLINELIHK